VERDECALRRVSESQYRVGWHESLEGYQQAYAVVSCAAGSGRVPIAVEIGGAVS